MFIAAAEIEKKKQNEKKTKTNHASYQKQVNMAAMCLILGNCHKNLCKYLLQLLQCIHVHVLATDHYIDLIHLV